MCSKRDNKFKKKFPKYKNLFCIFFGASAYIIAGRYSEVLFEQAGEVRLGAEAANVAYLADGVLLGQQEFGGAVQTTHSQQVIQLA